MDTDQPPTVWVLLIAARNDRLAFEKSANESWEAWYRKTGVPVVSHTLIYGYWSDGVLDRDERYPAESALLCQLEGGRYTQEVEEIVRGFALDQGFYLRFGQVTREEYTAVAGAITLLRAQGGQRVTIEMNVPAVGLMATNVPNQNAMGQ